MSEYPYIVYTDKKDVKVNGDTIESIAGESGGSNGVVIFKGTGDITLENITTDVTFEEIEAAYNNGNLMLFDLTVHGDWDVPPVYRLPLVARNLDIDTGGNAYHFALTFYSPYTITTYSLITTIRRKTLHILTQDLPIN